ncbi:MAG: hypothetical protein WCI74_03150 [Actinomycetes bacterium]
MPVFHATLMMNVTPAATSFIPKHTTFRPGQRLATDSRCELVVEASTPSGAANQVSAVASGRASDLDGRRWSIDVRPVYQGDVLRLQDLESGSVSWWACALIGWDQIPPPPGIPGGTVDLTESGCAVRAAQSA